MQQTKQQQPELETAEVYNFFQVYIFGMDQSTLRHLLESSNIAPTTVNSPKRESRMQSANAAAQKQLGYATNTQTNFAALNSANSSPNASVDRKVRICIFIMLCQWCIFRRV